MVSFDRIRMVSMLRFIQEEEAKSNKAILEALDKLIETTNKFYAKTEPIAQAN